MRDGLSRKWWKGYHDIINSIQIVPPNGLLNILRREFVMILVTRVVSSILPTFKFRFPFSTSCLVAVFVHICTYMDHGV